MYSVHLNDKQLRTLEKALDLYVNVSLGYVTTVTNSLIHVDTETRESLKSILANFEYGTPANPSVVRDYTSETVTQDVKIANDMLSVIGQFKDAVSFDGEKIGEVIKTANEPLMVIVKKGVRV